MASTVTSSEIDWRIYRKKLEKDLFHIRWHQMRSMQRIPRLTRTEGSPLKAFLASRGAGRRQQVMSRDKGEGNATEKLFESEGVPVASATPYRLPRLLDDGLPPEKPKDYVYKQPISASHFLIRKDPTRSTPVPNCTSPELRIKPNSTKCRPITQSMHTQIVYQTWPHGGAKMHHLLPRISQPGGVVVLTDSHVTEPKTPPQSEVEYHLLPSLSLQPSATKLHVTEGVTSSNQGQQQERKLSWQLSPYTNKNFDRQGLGPNQGPFSREMPVKCMPPNNWLRMKIRPRLMARR